MISLACDFSLLQCVIRFVGWPIIDVARARVATDVQTGMPAVHGGENVVSVGVSSLQNQTKFHRLGTGFLLQRKHHSTRTHVRAVGTCAYVVEAAAQLNRTLVVVDSNGRNAVASAVVCDKQLDLALLVCLATFEDLDGLEIDCDCAAVGTQVIPCY